MKPLLYILCLFVLSCDSGGGDTGDNSTSLEVTVLANSLYNGILDLLDLTDSYPNINTSNFTINSITCSYEDFTFDWIINGTEITIIPNEFQSWEIFSLYLLQDGIFATIAINLEFPE